MVQKQKPKPGDLIEIYRAGYQHWAIYVGDGYVIHLIIPSECAQAGSSSSMSVPNEKAEVKKEKLCKVVGDDDYCINNLLDNEYEPRPIQDILRDAHSLLGKRINYCVFTKNCEHFVTELRYGKPQSRQVLKAIEGGVTVLGTGFLGCAVLGSKVKQVQKK